MELTVPGQGKHEIESPQVFKESRWRVFRDKLPSAIPFLRTVSDTSGATHLVLERV